MTVERPDIAVFLYGPTSGGAPRRALTLAGEFAKRGLQVDLVLANSEGPLANRIPATARKVVLDGAFSRFGLLRENKRLASRLAPRASRLAPGALLLGAGKSPPEAGKNSST